MGDSAAAFGDDGEEGCEDPGMGNCAASVSLLITLACALNSAMRSRVLCAAWTTDSVGCCCGTCPWAGRVSVMADSVAAKHRVEAVRKVCLGAELEVGTKELAQACLVRNDGKAGFELRVLALIGFAPLR